MVVRPKDARLTRDFIRYGLLGGFSIADAISGTAQPQITRTSLAPIEVPVPPLEEQQRIVAKLNALNSDLDALRNIQITKRVELTSLRSSILSAAFAGDL